MKSKKPVGAVTAGITNTAAGPSMHPVATVMGYTSNPVGYTANYLLAILTDDDGEDKLDSSEVHTHVAAIIVNVDSTAPNIFNLPKVDCDHVAPLTVSHIFWCASVSPPNSLPSQFDCLLDIGSHLVIIYEQLANDLGLHHHKLENPIITDLVMQPDGPKVLKFNGFVKLRLYDFSGVYVTKTVHTVIFPTLCSPILLGLPFLEHNNIVIDVNACTAIDQCNSFDLLHPSAPHPKTSVKPRLCFN